MKAVSTILQANHIDNSGRILIPDTATHRRTWNREDSPDLEKALVALWTRLDQMFTGRWSREHGGLGSDDFKYLLGLLTDKFKDPDDVAAASVELLESGAEHPPSIPKLLALCKKPKQHAAHKEINRDFLLPQHCKGPRSEQTENKIAELRKQLKRRVLR